MARLSRRAMLGATGGLIAGGILKRQADAITLGDALTSGGGDAVGGDEPGNGSGPGVLR